MERYIRDSRRVQRRLGVGLIGGLLVSPIVWYLFPSIGIFIPMGVLFVAAIGFYITTMHIADWREQLFALSNKNNND